MKDIVQLARHMNKFGNIVVVILKMLKRKKVFDVFKVSSKQIIHAYNVKPFFYKSVAEVGTKEAGSTGYQYSFHNRCCLCRLKNSY